MHFEVASTVAREVPFHDGPVTPLAEWKSLQQQKLGLVEGDWWKAVVKGNTPKDQVLTYDDVAIPPGRVFTATAPVASV